MAEIIVWGTILILILAVLAFILYYLSYGFLLTMYLIGSSLFGIGLVYDEDAEYWYNMYEEYYEDLKCIEKILDYADDKVDAYKLRACLC